MCMLVCVCPCEEHYTGLSQVFCVDPVLKYIEVVSGCNGDDVFSRVPSHVQNLFSEVQTVHTHVTPPTPAPGVNAASP